VAKGKVYLAVLMKNSFINYLEFFRSKLSTKKKIIRSNIPTLNESTNENYLDHTSHFFKELSVYKG
jgi:hypothetical protein